jgi:hypothetical protein
MPGFGPLVPPGKTIAIPASDSFVLPRSVGKEDAAKVVREELDGAFRPADIEKAEMADIALSYIPVWRVDVSVEGFSLNLQRIGGSLTPSGGNRHREQVIVVSARRHLPFDPSAKLSLEMRDLVQRAKCKIPDSVIIEPDLPRADAEREACDRLRRAVEPTQALYSKFQAHVRVSSLCYYPVWVQRYRYTGEARGNAAPEECHVAVSGRTGEVVSSHHPSFFRSVASKIKSWFE